MLARGARLVLLAGLLLAPAAAARDVALEGYLDGLLGGLMETHHVPGAVVVVVHDGRVVVSKGYGLADVEALRPVDPDRTRFRVASVSKLFVATSVMQLVEQGKLDLDADVNRSLDSFRIEEGHGGPVTLWHLLTHTAGFDDRFLYTAEPLEAPVTPLGPYLAARMPPRVMPLGEVISYSNHGYALAGYLVERASGTPFAAYVAREILEPLGMTRSSFGIPTPVPEDVARPYVFRDGRFVDIGLDRLRDAPAGDLLTTGADMARFMLAHLGDGELGGVRILRRETAREMRRQQFTMHPSLEGWCLGFAEERRNGQRAVGHGGNTRGFGTQLTLVPQAQLGWFVSTNHDYHGAFFEALQSGLWERFFPVAARSPPEPPPEFAFRAGEYTGSYVPNRRVRGDFLKTSELLLEVRVAAGADGTLALHSRFGGLRTLRLVAVGPDHFVSTQGEQHAVAQRDASGRVSRLVIESVALDRLPAWRSPRLHALAGAALAALFAATLVGWGLGAVGRAWLGAAPSPTTRAARGVGALVCALDGALLVGLGVLAADPDIWAWMADISPARRALLWLPVASLPFTLALPLLLLRGFRGSAPLARLHYGLLTAGAFLVVLGAWTWHLTPLGLR